MMNMQQFIDYVKENILEYLPYKDASVREEKIQKNNGVVLDAITIFRENVNISPTIYVKEYFSEYEKGKELDEILKEIASTQQQYDLGESIDITLITDFSKVKDKIVPRLINAKKNEELLKSRPHKIIEDLAIIYQIEMNKNDDAVMSTAIHNGLLESYGITIDELHQIATANIEDVLHPTLMSMREMLGEIIPEGRDEEMLPKDDPSGMHILTCKSKSYGAVVALNETVMNKISEEFGSFFILPSSVHELIILPDDGKASVGELEALVNEVNETQVAEQDMLSEHVYRYDRQAKTIMLASAA